MQFLQTFIIVVIILALCVLGLGIQIFFSKKKRFPQYEVGENEEMQKRGIYCMNKVQQMIDREIIEGHKHTDYHDDCSTCALLSAGCKIKDLKLQKQ